MPTFTQFEAMAFEDISETLFLGGTTLTARTANGFTTVLGQQIVVFDGSLLTYDASGHLTHGKVNAFYVYTDVVDPLHLQLSGGGSGTLLTASQIRTAFALYDTGDSAAANALILGDWATDLFSLSNFSKDAIHGYAGNDSLHGVHGRDQIYGREGDDTIASGFFGSLTQGDAGNDLIYGGEGKDTAYGGDGDDVLSSTPTHLFKSRDVLNGDAGNDSVLAIGRLDTVNGGAGNDTVSGAFAYGGAGDDSVLGSALNSHVFGGLGNDSLAGGDKADTLFGDGGNDLILGDTGNDVLSGGDGADRLIGGDGSDMLSGGAGRDVFVFGPETGADTITDYEASLDHISLADFHFANRAAALAIMTDTAGGDTLFQFSASQTLVVTGVSVAEILSTLLI